jgi:hypothetical protein
MSHHAVEAGKLRLDLDQVVEQPFCSINSCGRAHLDQLAALEADDAVGIVERRQAVSDGDGGAALHQRFQRFLDLALGLGIDRRGGLVQESDLGVEQDGARNRDALALAARQARAALAHDGVVAFGQVGDKVVGIGRLGRADDLFCAPTSGRA